MNWTGVSGRQISTGSAQIDPAKTDEIVDLFLMAAVATTVPIEGRIEYIFPLESRLPYETEKNCQLVSGIGIFQIYEITGFLMLI